MVIIKKTRNNKFDEDIKKRDPLCTVGGKVNWCNHYAKQYGGIFKK